MSIFGKLFKAFAGKQEKESRPDPKPRYKHYGQQPKPDAKRHQKFGPKKD